jgi:Fic family protein
VPAALGAPESFLHQQDDLPPLVRVALAHVQFETIHPFLDGNGRVGRLLITFLLVEMGILQQPVLYLSHYFRQHRSTYYDKLQAVRDKGAWEDRLDFFLRGVVDVAREATGTARRILQMREAHRSIITQQLGRAAGNGHLVLEALFTRPIVTVADVMEITGSSFVPANNLVSGLERAGILKEVSGFARNRRFQYDAYLQLLTS